MKKRGLIERALLWLSKKAHGNAAYSYRNVLGNRLSRLARWVADR